MRTSDSVVCYTFLNVIYYLFDSRLFLWLRSDEHLLLNERLGARRVDLKKIL